MINSRETRFNAKVLVLGQGLEAFPDHVFMYHVLLFDSILEEECSFRLTNDLRGTLTSEVLCILYRCVVASWTVYSFCLIFEGLEFIVYKIVGDDTNLVSITVYFLPLVLMNIWLSNS